jgi:hypothetical protein
MSAVDASNAAANDALGVVKVNCYVLSFVASASFVTHAPYVDSTHHAQKLTAIILSLGSRVSVWQHDHSLGCMHGRD